MRTPSTICALLFAIFAIPVLAAPVSPECRCDSSSLSLSEIRSLFASLASKQALERSGRQHFSFASPSKTGRREDERPTPVFNDEYPLTTAQLMALSSLQADFPAPSGSRSPESAPTSALRALEKEEALRMTRCQRRLAARARMERMQTQLILGAAGLTLMTVIFIVLVFVADTCPRLRRLFCCFRCFGPRYGRIRLQDDNSMPYILRASRNSEEKSFSSDD